ncbi:mitochondrial enolase superfamily member 1 [Eudromia elegans]
MARVASSGALWICDEMNGGMRASCPESRARTEPFIGKRELKHHCKHQNYPGRRSSCLKGMLFELSRPSLCTWSVDTWKKSSAALEVSTEISAAPGSSAGYGACGGAAVEQMAANMLNENQQREIKEAVELVTELDEFKPLWIKEPTSPDDILGHAATAECQSRVIFKQLLQAKALTFLQNDSCRLGSVNENLSVLLMAKKLCISVCPHTGGTGLRELLQHLKIFACISVSANPANRKQEKSDRSRHLRGKTADKKLYQVKL